MYRDKIRIGLMPTRRPIFIFETAVAEYDKIIPTIKAQLPQFVEFVDIEDVCEKGIATFPADIDPIVRKFKAAEIDALFVPFCDFGCEEVVVSVAKQFKLPTLIWGTRDIVSTFDLRGRDTQCGLFAATKVLLNYGVTFSYIWNCEADSPDFVKGFRTFVQTCFILKALRNLNVAEIGDRPKEFYSVIHNQLDLIQNLNITVKPIPLKEVSGRTKAIIAANTQELQDYVADFRSRVDCPEESDDYVLKVCAGTLAIEQLLKENNCRCAAFDCVGIRFALELSGSACAIEGELADRGYPTACEADVWGAISSLMLAAASMGTEASFLADWTYRHPTNNNAELVWHGGSFAWSLASKKRKPRLSTREFTRRKVSMYKHYFAAWWEMKHGDITTCRLDEWNGTYYLFVGEGTSCEGPETTGTYVWFEVDNWKKWEEHLIFYPFIHHVGGVYGRYTPALIEAARYLGFNVITPDSPCPASL